MSGREGLIGAGVEPPWNIEAEQGLLGTMLLDPRVFDDIGDKIGPDHFYHPAHQRIYAAIAALHGQGMSPSPVTLRNFFTDDADLKDVGGAKYLADLAAGVISVINAEDYARTISELHQRRQLLSICGSAIQKARTPRLDVSADDVLSELEGDLFRISEGGSESAPVGMIEGLHETTSLIQDYQQGRVRGVMTGIGELDERTNGLHKGHLIIVAGRPSMGKTAFLCTVSYNVAEFSQGKALIFSMEMPRTEIIQRYYARLCNIPTGMQMRTGALQYDHWRTLAAAQQELSRLQIHIDDTPALNVMQIRSRARRHKRKFGLDIIIIDQLTKIALPAHYQNKVDQIGFITDALKNLARELDVPVVLLHQLSREVEKREDKRPQLSDLRDSGNIEQDADAVMFLYRDEYYLERTDPKRTEKESDEKYNERTFNHQQRLQDSRGKAEIIVAKWRQGVAGMAHVGFNGARQIFHDLDYQP